MSLNGSVILIELNELTPALISRFMQAGALPNFQRFFRESQVFTTDAGEAGLRLNPWIQWVTVHTGLPLDEHGVMLLGERPKLPTCGVVDRVAEAGGRVWMCGSMNIPFQTPLPGAVLPDPWSADSAPFPGELDTYLRMVRHHVQEHTNPDSRLGAGDYARFGAFMATHGLSPSTVWAAARQLARERGGRYGWKRISILDRLQFDLFRHYHRKIRPHLSTFFTNSVAHMQHTRWRNLEPERFDVKPSASEQAEFHDAVEFAYRENDATIGRFLDLAGEDTTLVFLTALSQQPDVRYEEIGGKRFYRPRDFQRLVAFAGITGPHECAPVMSEEFWLRFEDEPAAQRAAQRLEALQVGGKRAFRAERREREIYTGCDLSGEVEPDAKLVSAESGAAAPFYELLYQAETLKSGVHHPDGLLWIRRPDRRHTVHAGKVPLTAVAPSVLRMLGVEIPSSMKEAPLL
jgi:hypothetical protein